MEHQLFDEFFRAASPEVDVEAIRQAWGALCPPFRVEERCPPAPVWARRPFVDTGSQAWATLRRDLARGDVAKPFCIYVHIPFCDAHCGFCDCYSFALKTHREQHTTHYLGSIQYEIGLWGQQGTLPERPVSTVHLGGGTPTFLDGREFSQLTRDLRRAFNTSDRTEWALESTTAALTDDKLALLNALGFTRLHIGIQSLQDEVRTRINRRELSGVVLEKITRAVALGWVVSVDLIAGLPGQSLAGLLGDIRALEAVGIEGFSVYELQLSNRNRSFAERSELMERPRLFNYLLMQAAFRELARLGYAPTLFNHFARGRDTDLYFTFPERGEDCLALGTIADGVFGDYHYRHPEYSAYARALNDVSPGLQGGLRRSELENRLFPLETALLSGSIQAALFAKVLGVPEADRLFHRWRESALIADTSDHAHMRLTANGSWFAGAMMAELPAVYAVSSGVGVT
jgi:coproporphyrinogen III oxidase-like Fe-S oxidoreductase